MVTAEYLWFARTWCIAGFSLLGESKGMSKTWAKGFELKKGLNLLLWHKRLLLISPQRDATDKILNYLKLREGLRW